MDKFLMVGTCMVLSCTYFGSVICILFVMVGASSNAAAIAYVPRPEGKSALGVLHRVGRSNEQVFISAIRCFTDTIGTATDLTDVHFKVNTSTMFRPWLATTKDG